MLARSANDSSAQRGDRADGDAMWLRSPCLGHVRSRAGGADVTIAGGRSTRSRSRRLLRRCRTRLAALDDARLAEHAPNVRTAGSASGSTRDPPRLLRRVGVVDPDAASTRTARTAATRRCARALELGPDGVIREVTDVEAGRPRRRRFPTGRKWEAVARAAGAPALPGLQRRRVRARHVQGSRADGRRSVRRRRGDDDRRRSRPAASTATSTSAANTRWRPSGCSDAHRAGARARPARRAT